MNMKIISCYSEHYFRAYYSKYLDLWPTLYDNAFKEKNNAFKEKNRKKKTKKMNPKIKSNNTIKSKNEK